MNYYLGFWLRFLSANDRLVRLGVKVSHDLRTFFSTANFEPLVQIVNSFVLFYSRCLNSG